MATTGVIIPLYDGDPPSSTWLNLVLNTIVPVKRAHPNVPVVLIMNPSSGPTGSANSGFQNVITQMHNVGGQVIGYVFTGYNDPSNMDYQTLAQVEANINLYKSEYPNLNGIFFDEMANVTGSESHYSTLSSYAHSQGFALTVGNPGATTISSYVGTMDNICVYESGPFPSSSQIASEVCPSGNCSFPKSNFSIIAYQTADPGAATLQAAAQKVQYIYASDAGPSYAGLTSYFSDLVTALDVGGIATSLTLGLKTV